MREEVRMEWSQMLGSWCWKEDDKQKPQEDGIVEKKGDPRQAEIYLGHQFPSLLP